MSIKIPAIQEIIESNLTKSLHQLHVAMPGVVDRYDSAKQTVDVVISVKNIVLKQDNTAEIREYAIVPSVPVLFARTSTYQISMPIASGDKVLLVFCDTDLSQWSAANPGSLPISPGILWEHTLNGAVAIPGLYPPQVAAGANGPLETPGSDAIHIGKRDSMGSADFAAMAAKVLTELERIETAFNGHTHGYDAPVHVDPTPGTTVGPSSSITIADSVACSDVKVT